MMLMTATLLLCFCILLQFCLVVASTIDKRRRHWLVFAETVDWSLRQSSQSCDQCAKFQFYPSNVGGVSHYHRRTTTGVY